MDRKLLVTIHLYLSAFFAPAIILVSVSGGLYLLGVKGNVSQETVFESDSQIVDSQSTSLHEDVLALLGRAGIQDYSFEYVKVKGSTLYTRPTSSDHFIIESTEAGTRVIQARPSLQSRMIELHKGHGPTLFKTFQKVFALGLVFIICSGLWLGLSSTRLRKTTLLTTLAGCLVCGILLL